MTEPDFIQVKLRIPSSLRRKLEREAKKNGRSVNVETVDRLERSFISGSVGQGRTAPDQSVASYDQLLEQMDSHIRNTVKEAASEAASEAARGATKEVMETMWRIIIERTPEFLERSSPRPWKTPPDVRAEVSLPQDDPKAPTFEQAKKLGALGWRLERQKPVRPELIENQMRS
jgi:hypothetical protein